MFQFLNRSLGRILDKRSRPDQRRFWAMFTVVALTLGSLALTPWTAQAEDPGDIFAEACSASVIVLRMNLAPILCPIYTFTRGSRTQKAIKQPPRLAQIRAVANRPL